MITVKVSLENPGVLFLGRRGEKNARKFVLDAQSWSAGFPQGEYRLLILRPGEATPYLAKTEVTEAGLVYIPQPEDIAICGEGSMELQLCTGETILKSARMGTVCESALGDSEAAYPTHAPGWFHRVLEAVEGRTFVAVYGVTTLSQLQKAWQEGCALVCRKDTACASMSYAGKNALEFSLFEHPIIYNYRVTEAGWMTYTINLASRYAGTDHTHTPEAVGAVPALGESIIDPEVSIDDLTMTKCYLCGATVISRGLGGNLPFDTSFFLKVEDFAGTGTRAIQTAVLNSTNTPQRKWRLWNGSKWSAWQEG